jgi:hypothetical protein
MTRRTNIMKLLREWGFPAGLVTIDAAAQPDFGVTDLTRELLLPLRAVRLGMVLVRRDTPRTSDVIGKIDATLQAMERVVDELRQ